jgi:indolepyruvate ferredoxin oxidoreductase
VAARAGRRPAIRRRPEEILVVEEKRQIVEYQLKEQLYNWRDDVRPRVIGKFDEKGEWVRPHGDWLLPRSRADAGDDRARDRGPHPAARPPSRARWKSSTRASTGSTRRRRALAKPKIMLERIPYFCSGCPHNTSTNVPKAAARPPASAARHGDLDGPPHSTFTHMGGEGVPWIGQAPFTDEKHIFANLGDGTYYHSGSLAIRAAVAAKVNITYKILYNDAVAMTGGQPVEGRSRRRTSRARCAAEGVAKIVVVSDEPDKYPSGYFLRATSRSTTATARRRFSGSFAKRRLHGAALRPDVRGREKARQKRGKYPRYRRSAWSSTSSCARAAATAGSSRIALSVAPVETEFGRKRTIDQSSCNKDYSCVNGFCPSFVTVEGGSLRKAEEGGGRRVPAAARAHASAPTADPYGIVVTGIGGHRRRDDRRADRHGGALEGKGCSVLDMTGLAQKNGAVVSHVRIADRPEQIHATRIAGGEAKLVLGCDILTGVGYDALAKMQKGVTKALVNSALVMPAGFTRDPDLAFPWARWSARSRTPSAPGDAEFLDATKLATGLMGDSIATNSSWSVSPTSAACCPSASGDHARDRIERHRDRAEQAELPLGAPCRGRSRARARPAIPMATPESQRLSESLDEIVARRAEFLTAIRMRRTQALHRSRRQGAR